MEINLTEYPESTGQRVDSFLSGMLEESRTRIKKLADEQQITINGKPGKASHVLTGNEIINITIPEVKKLDLTPKDMHLDVIYEDKDILLINKPVGVVVHPGAGTGDDTLVHGLLHHCDDLSGIGGVERPGIIHRLDKDTSGIMLIAKNDVAHHNLSAQFKNRSIEKFYLALTEGIHNQPSGVINYPIGRNPKDRKKMAIFKNISEAKANNARSAITEYQIAGEKDNKTLLEVKILTGRTHQIRVHLAAIGHPVIGDPIYGNKTGKRQLLHAYRLKFTHPTLNTIMEFQTPLPPWAKGYMKTIDDKEIPK